MIKNVENKAIKPQEMKAEQYIVFIGDEQIAVEATSQEEAQAKAQKLINK